MRTFLKNIEVSNFRGIENCYLSGLSGLNIFVGANGVGKTSLQNVIARFYPILFGWPNVFRDGDFRFSSPAEAPPINISYGFKLYVSDTELMALGKEKNHVNHEADQNVITCVLCVHVSRNETGTSMGALNNGTPADYQSKLHVLRNGSKELDDSLLSKLQCLSPLLIRVIGSGGLVPIRHPKLASKKEKIPIPTLIPTNKPGTAMLSVGYRDKKPEHAATSELANTSADSLRARLVQVLTNGEKAEEVNKRYPNLIDSTLQLFNELRGVRDIIDISVTDSEELFFKRSEGLWTIWRDFSDGEQVLFGFVWMEIISKLESYPMLLVEEPEKNIHIGQQRPLLRKIIEYANHNQVFMSTHSTSFLEIDAYNVDVKHILLSKSRNEIAAADVTNVVPTVVLSQIGMTAKSVAQPKFRFLVEGPSDAFFFQSCLEKLFEECGHKNFNNLIEFVICGGSSVLRTHGTTDSIETPGVVIEEYEGEITHKINIAHAGVEQQYLLFDADGNSKDATALADSLVKKFGDSDKITIIEPWYKTLENLYSREYWRAALPKYEFKEGLRVTRKIKSKDFWVDFVDIQNSIFSTPLAKSTLKTRKVEMAVNISNHIRMSAASKFYSNNLSGILSIVEDIKKRNGK